jgi:hypothetical protein
MHKASRSDPPVLSRVNNQRLRHCKYLFTSWPRVRQVIIMKFLNFLDGTALTGYWLPVSRVTFLDGKRIILPVTW